jgi:hypothetical protein
VRAVCAAGAYLLLFFCGVEKKKKKKRFDPFWSIEFRVWREDTFPGVWLIAESKAAPQESNPNLSFTGFTGF